MIHSERITILNQKDIRKQHYVLYWMQQAQRAEFNHALEYAIREANRLQLPLLAVFGITQRYPDANVRHYSFMLEGLKKTQTELAERGIKLVVRLAPPVTAVAELAEHAVLVVVDRGYLKIQKKWRSTAATRVPCAMAQVETDVVVPVDVASNKEEFAARTIRPKIHQYLNKYLAPLEESSLKRDSLGMKTKSFPIDDLSSSLQSLKLSRSLPCVTSFRGGTSEAKKLLQTFIASKLHLYAEKRSDPNAECESHMSPYLHFGQISPLYIALQVLRSKHASLDSRESYLEELIVRRELSMNFCEFNSSYDSYEALPSWAQKTLREHRTNGRSHIYSLLQLENAKTHDVYWNAAQAEMLKTGKMHNYMRMYWGKKILQWSRTPEEAYKIALYLNNKYELDGRDPNSYAGVAWCFGKHDRPWGKREIFGTVRSMGAKGLEKKFDIIRYVKKVNDIPAPFPTL